MARLILWVTIICGFVIIGASMFTGDELSDKGVLLIFGSLGVLALGESIESLKK
jgi:hypothetical protein